MKQKLILGCIADDFTGASDAASFLVKGGLNTILYNGVPAATQPLPEHTQAVVIALKTRMQSTPEAVAVSLEAINWLEQKGAEQFYVKYCSTFDSTPTGNIGPIVDAVMQRLQVQRTLLCPALPANGRTVKDGILYVNGVPLADSPMRNHPLTPMWDSRIAELMERQGRYRCFTASDQLMKRPAALQQELVRFQEMEPCFYIVPDFVQTEDAELLVALFGDEKLLTGGSGLLESWARYLKEKQDRLHETKTGGERQLILAGSCSAMTLAQIDRYQQQGGISLKLDPQALLDGNQSVPSLWQSVLEYERPVLLYSSDVPERVKMHQSWGAETVSRVLEQTMASLARRAVDAGFGAVIVAGGETSGAVVKELQYDAYEIGASVAPGVPVMTPVARPEFHLVLKSGNFGDEDFFQKALAATQNEPEATKEKKREAAAICKDLFTRGLVTGSSANLSFRLGESLYISASGASFGTITENEFVPVTLDGQWSGTRRPSKEYPLHLAVYQAHPQVQAVIHTHSIYSVLWSCLQPDGCLDCVPAYTPYLRMKVGKIGLVPYAPPGSDTLVSLFEQMVSASDGWLLANHGPIVAGKSLQDTLYALEELEQSCRVAWELQSHPAARCSES